jgi:hypothetical protein
MLVIQLLAALMVDTAMRTRRGFQRYTFTVAGLVL